jgi:hypothetical protein
MAGAEEIFRAAEDLDGSLIDLEMGLTDLRLSGGTAGQDQLRWPRQLYAKITSLAGYIGGSDFPPTTQQLEVHERYKGLLREARLEMEAVKTGPLAALNRLLVEKGIPHVTEGQPGGGRAPG